MAKVIKKYNWEAVVWLESLGTTEENKPDIERIIDFGVKGYISPLHVDSEKPHFHVIWCFDRQVSYDSVMSMIEEESLDDCINTVKYVKDLTSRGRYLCHLDESKKLHYSPDLVTCMGGLSYNKFLNYETDSAMEDLSLFKLIDRYKIRSYSQLVRYCAFVRTESYRSIVGRCSFWSSYLKSLNFDTNSVELENIINEKAGLIDET